MSKKQKRQKHATPPNARQPQAGQWKEIVVPTKALREAKYGPGYCPVSVKQPGKAGITWVPEGMMLIETGVPGEWHIIPVDAVVTPRDNPGAEPRPR